MNIDLAEQILKSFAEKSREVTGLVLVSSDGEPVSTAIGIEENTTLLISGIFLEVGHKIAEECQWKQTEQISLHAHEGCLTLLPCTDDFFILIKTNNMPNGRLEKEIQQVIKQLEKQFQGEQVISDNPPVYSSSSSSSPVSSLYSPPNSEPVKKAIALKPDPEFVQYCQQELAEFIGPIASVLCQRILKKNPDITINDWVETLVKSIPNPEQAQEFRLKLYRMNFSEYRGTPWGITPTDDYR